MAFQVGFTCVEKASVLVAYSLHRVSNRFMLSTGFRDLCVTLCWGAMKITTIAHVEGAKPNPARQIDYPDARVRGLALRVTPAGGKSWTLRYRTQEGRQRRMSLGGFPAVGLSEARDKARAKLGEVASGRDPAEEKQVVRMSARAGRLNTITGLIESYLGDAEQGRHRPNARPKRPGTMALDRYYFERHIKPRLGTIAVEELTRSKVQEFLDDVGRNAPSTARHCRAVLRQAYNYAIRRERAKSNPAQLADLPAPKQRDRVMTDAELRAIWDAADVLALRQPSTGLAIKFAMLTLQRGGEVTGIHSNEIDWNSRTWTLPADRTKNHRLHIVPLSDGAMAVLSEAFGDDREGQAFPSRRGAKGASIRRDSISKALRRLTKKLGVENATPHDFRRTGGTNITGERIGMPRFIVSRVLNQISDSGGAAAVTAVYDRNDYLADKRRALDAWAARLKEIVATG